MWTVELPLGPVQTFGQKEKGKEMQSTVRDILMHLLLAEFNLGEVCHKKILLAYYMYKSY